MSKEEQKRVDLYRRNPAVALAAYGSSYFKSLGLEVRPPRPRSRTPRAASIYNREYYRRHRAKILARAKTYHEQNREARSAYYREYLRRNRREILERRRNATLDKQDNAAHEETA